MNIPFSETLDKVMRERVRALSEKRPDPYPGSSGDKVVEQRLLGIVATGFDPYPGSTNDKTFEEVMRWLANDS